MPRGKKAPKKPVELPAQEQDDKARVLAELGLTPADQPPVAEQPPPQTEIIEHPEREVIRQLASTTDPESSPHIKAIIAARDAKSRTTESRHEDEHADGPLHERNGQPNDRELIDPPFEPGSFAAKVTESVHAYRPVPPEFRRAYSDSHAGIRVFRRVNGSGRHETSTVAIQFSDARPPSRDEKNILEAIHEPDDALSSRSKFTYKTADSMWERNSVPGEPPGANVIDGVHLAQELAEARNRERGQGR